MNQSGGAERFKGFAKSFKSYMSVAAIVAAALPIPVTAWKLIPIFKHHSGILQVYTPLLCFLIFSFVFYSRHWIGRLTYGRQLGKTGDPGPGPAILAFLPLLFIVATLLTIVLYHRTLDESVSILLGPNSAMSEEYILSATERYQIPFGTELVSSYILIFVCAELAFVLMYLREYLQDILKLSDNQIISGSKANENGKGEA